MQPVPQEVVVRQALVVPETAMPISPQMLVIMELEEAGRPPPSSQTEMPCIPFPKAQFILSQKDWAVSTS